jgi:hypothetical protein
LAVSDSDGKVEYAMDGRDGLVPGVRGASAVAQQAAHLGAGSAGRGSGGDVGVVKRIGRCTHLECGQQTWTESHPQIRPRAAWTERARKQACRRVGRDGHSVAAVARDFGLPARASPWHYCSQSPGAFQFVFRNITNHEAPGPFPAQATNRVTPTTTTLHHDEPLLKGKACRRSHV